MKTRRQREVLETKLNPTDYEAQHSLLVRLEMISDNATGDAFSSDSDECRQDDTAIEELRSYLEDIFDTKDDFDIIILQSKIETQLRRVIALRQFAQVPLDVLLKFQRLCKTSLEAAEAVDITVEGSMGKFQSETWSQQVLLVILGLLSSRNCLLIMCGGRAERQLYSEDAIRTTVAVLKTAIDAHIIPAFELRSSATRAMSSKQVSVQRKAMATLMAQCERLLQQVATLAGHTKLSGTVTNALEIMSLSPIFAGNMHADSLFDNERIKFENLRVAAVELMVQLFAEYPRQRSGILNHILTMWEKLPATKRGARHFKLPRGGNIQLVSALIMRLIQTATKQLDDVEAGRIRATFVCHGSGEEGVEANFEQRKEPNILKRSSRVNEDRMEVTPWLNAQELSAMASAVLDTARTNATEFVNFIVGRALRPIHSGGTSFRNILKLFIEDLVASLDHPEWPAAEVLLRLLLVKMVQIAEGKDFAPGAKILALEFLGLMGAAISALTSYARQAALSNESQSIPDCHLWHIAEASLEMKSCSKDVVAWEGPFRAALAFLICRSFEDRQLSSAVEYLIARWIFIANTTYNTINNADIHGNNRKHFERLAFELSRLAADGSRGPGSQSDCVSDKDARLTYVLTLLHSQFFGSMERVLGTLLITMASEQSMVRSKCLKTILKVVESDPSVLDREPTIKSVMLRSTNDTSTAVRDSALHLIGRCVELKPGLEMELLPCILQRICDVGIGVRKHAMKLAKEIYLQNGKTDARCQIVDTLLCRVTDLDESVRELACQAIEEIWVWPFYHPTLRGFNSALSRPSMTDHVALIVSTAHRSRKALACIALVFQKILCHKSESAAVTLTVCMAFITTMFDLAIFKSTSRDEVTPSARGTLKVLEVFAETNADFFTAKQLQRLQPHFTEAAGGDIGIFRSVVTILRYTLPHFPDVDHKFLKIVRKNLMRQLTRFNRSILEEVVPCLWTISKILHETELMVNLLLSSLDSIGKMQEIYLQGSSERDSERELTKLLLIAGMCGKHCEFDAQMDCIRARLPSWSCISELIIGAFKFFLSPNRSVGVRRAAFEATAMVCQAFPKNFTSIKVYESFEEAFDEDNRALVVVVMKSFKAFLLAEERRSRIGQTRNGTPDLKTDLAIMGGSEQDGAAAFIAQKFMSNRRDLMRIALATQDDTALLATEVLASMNRQGLLHPKECAPLWIALDTSQNVAIAELSSSMHRTLHEKYATILEKKYMLAVQFAYQYQRDVVEDTRGATVNPYLAKLHMMIDVMKISKVKNRKIFYNNLCTQIDIDLAKISSSYSLDHLQHAQFIIENMAFFEYASSDEVIAAITAMEKVANRVGIVTASMIDIELAHTSGIQELRPVERDQFMQALSFVDFRRLQTLAATSMILVSLWSTATHLRQKHSLVAVRCDDKSEAHAVLKRASVNMQDINNDTYWEQLTCGMDAMQSRQGMVLQCHTFILLFSEEMDANVAAAMDKVPRARSGIPCGEEAIAKIGTCVGTEKRKPKKTSRTTRPQKKPRHSSKTRSTKLIAASINDDNQDDMWV